MNLVQTVMDGSCGFAALVLVFMNYERNDCTLTLLTPFSFLFAIFSKCCCIYIL